MASQSRSEPRNRFPSPSPVLAPFTSAAMSTISKLVYTSFFELDIWPSRSTRSSGTCASATAVSVVEKGWAATTVSAPVSALKRLDLPLLGRPTRPRRSTARGGYREGNAVLVAVAAARNAPGPSATLMRCDGGNHEQEDDEAQAALPPEQSQPRQAPELGTPVDRDLPTVSQWLAAVRRGSARRSAPSARHGRSGPARRAARSRPRPARWAPRR